MEAIGQLAGGIAHDFNNALTAILGNADLLAKKVSPSFPFIENINDIRKSALRSASMTRQLLAFARKQMITPIVCPIDEEIGNLRPMIESLIGSHIHFLWHPGSNNACVLIDPSQIDQIVINLCINARDAISEHGTITIETKTITITAEECSTGNPCQISGEYVRITVCDSGCGIDPRALPHIYEPFYTTKEIGKGTGLGLSTVYGILKQNKGCIDCMTEPGQGTTFIVCLPVYHEFAEKRPNEPDDMSFRFSNETIMLVEDSSDILAILKGLLEEKGFRIVAARDAETALSLARHYPPGTIDLLVTDIMLPGINGIRLSEQIQTIQPGLKTLFMSGYSQETFPHQNNLDIEASFIQKPFSINSFLSYVSKMLASSGIS
jgi:CheY-like chemotaxis protein